VSARAVIADRRFQHYEGPRLGVLYAIGMLSLHSLGWVLGSGRTSRYKIVPSILLFFVYGICGIQILGAADGQVTGYYRLYIVIFTAIYIFVALVSPELVCPDRRHGTLRMYTTSNLGPYGYLAAKLLAVWGALAVMTVGPLLLMLAGYSLLGHGPANLGDAARTLAQIVGGGLVMAVFFGTLGLAASSLTDRSAFASAGIILGLVLSAAAIGILQGAPVGVGGQPVGGQLKAPDWVRLVALSELPQTIVTRIYGARDFNYSSLPTWELAAAAAGWVLGGIAVLVLRYRPEE
jgi:ABC-2 type transport system permease protein